MLRPSLHIADQDVAAAAAALRLRRHTTRRLAVGAAGGQQVAGGVQPPQPGHAQASGGAGDAPGAGDGRSVENFIPLRYPDLRDRLVDAYPEFFADAAVKAQFYALAERLSLRNLIECVMRRCAGAAALCCWQQGAPPQLQPPRPATCCTRNPTHSPRLHMRAG